MKLKVITLLSAKSSGSSALQNYLHLNFGLNLLRNTPHQENETLFWTKASSALSLPQKPMHKSVVPYSTIVGRKLLQKLLLDNGVIFDFKCWDEAYCFNAFKQLILSRGPVFFEKSPHHLFNYSNIELMLKCKEYLKDEVDFHLIGLVRNPLDTVYSAWNRWSYNCKAFEQEWYQSYSNLEQLKGVLSELTIFRYEEVVQNSTLIDTYCAQIGLQKINNQYSFNRQSLSKRITSTVFGHRLKPQTIALAKHFGYNEDELQSANSGSILWSLSEAKNSLLYELVKIKRKLTSKK